MNFINQIKNLFKREEKNKQFFGASLISYYDASKRKTYPSSKPLKYYIKRPGTPLEWFK